VVSADNAARSCRGRFAPHFPPPRRPTEQGIVVQTRFPQAAQLEILVATASPWPGALLIRAVFDRDAAKVKAALQAHAPEDVRRIGDQRYGDGPDTLLDVYLPTSVAGGEQVLPTIVWTDGVAWTSGNRRDAAPYFEILASAGYTVVALGYSVGPARQYPTAVYPLNGGLRYLQENAERLHIDRPASCSRATRRAPSSPVSSQPSSPTRTTLARWASRRPWTPRSSRGSFCAAPSTTWPRWTTCVGCWAGASTLRPVLQRRPPLRE